ncbi:MAG: NAD(P)H-dependent glycerol-3-phosphate dehydrogenase [Nitrospinales bacterium]
MTTNIDSAHSFGPIGVIGAGSWGTALSLLLARKNHQIDLWVYEKDLLHQIKDFRENKLFLPGYKIPENIIPTGSIENAISGKKIILLVAPTHVIRKILTSIREIIEPNCIIINASKGIENDSLFTSHQMMQEVLTKPYIPAILSGPTFAKEIAEGVPSCAVAACKDQGNADIVKNIFSSPQFKVFTSTDIIGVELGGALKNVMAIATGISDGLKLGFNTRAALITRGLVEITRIGVAMGARPETFSGLSGVGDLVLTCTGDLSRNRAVGIKIGQGQSLKQITSNMTMVAEGVRTVKSAYELKSKLGIKAAIIDETYKMLYEEKSPKEALKDLMKVEVSSEFLGVKGI